MPQTHPPTSEEARASLIEIDGIAARIRKTIAAGVVAPLLILWGAIWAFGFAVTQFWPDAAGRLWTWLGIGGITASIFLGGWFRQTPNANPRRGRIGLSWLMLLAYAFVWLLLLVPSLARSAGMGHVPDQGHRISAFCCTVGMFGYIIMGLWLSRFLLWLGFLITALTLIGFFLLPGYFYIWMAITGGGALFAVGIYVRLAWR